MELILQDLNLLEAGKDYLIDIALAADAAIAEWRIGHVYCKYNDPLFIELQNRLEALAISQDW